MTLTVYYDGQAQQFAWELFDGPDGIDHRQGTAGSLLECFLAIEHARTEIAQHYI